MSFPKNLISAFFVFALISCGNPGSDPSSNDAEESPPPSNQGPASVVERARGLDISYWQEDELNNLNVDSLGIDFIVCKMTKGDGYLEKDFHDTWSWMQKQPILKGVYHFYYSKGKTSLTPEQQANFFLTEVEKLEGLDFPLMIDFEGIVRAEGETIEEATNRFIAFLKPISQSAGRKPIIYVNPYNANTYLTDESFGQYPLWISDYGTNQPEIPIAWKKHSWHFWQKTDSFYIGKTRNDLDVYHGNLKALKKFCEGT